MDAEVKNEKATDDEQVPNLIEPKQEVDDTVESIEPKVELIDEMDVKKEEIDEQQYQHIIPYEYRDYLEQHTEKEQPTNSRKRPAEDSPMHEGNSSECQKCGINVLSHVKLHVIRHTGLKMYECPASQCSFKDYQSGNVTTHIKRKHKSCTDPVRKIEMSDKEKQVLKDMLHECYPGRELKVCTCALEHADIMLYKCSVPDCQVKTNNHKAMIYHEVKIHGLLVEYSGKCRISVTTAQIDETERMFIRCFPDSSKKEIIN